MSRPTTFADLIGIFLTIIEAIIPIIASLALLVFFWGLAKFILNVSGDEKAVGEGKKLMVWGLVGLFVMISVWGIIRFASGELGFGTTLTFPLLPE